MKKPVLQKRVKPAVEITVVFSETLRNGSSMSRFFDERKRTLEGKQRQEFSH